MSRSDVYKRQLFPRLEERSWQLAGTLSGGEQQMLAVGRALMSRPKLMTVSYTHLDVYKRQTRNTVRNVLAALCFHVSSKKLKTFWSKSLGPMSVSDRQRKKLYFLKSANLSVYQIHLIV